MLLIRASERLRVKPPNKHKITDVPAMPNYMFNWFHELYETGREWGREDENLERISTQGKLPFDFPEFTYKTQKNIDSVM